MTANGQSPVSYNYDTASRLTQVAQGSQVVGLGYDFLGRRTTLSYPNGTSTNYTYDPASRLTRILHQGPTSIIEDLTYTYDAAGNRISFSRSGPQAALPAAVQAAYDAANQQIQFNAATPNLAYDANGNLTSQTDASGTTFYTWDARNRLIGISGPSITASSVYDALGRRVSKTINGEKTDYQYDGNDISAEILGGAVVATYLRSLNIDQPFVRQSSSPEFYHADALGSTLALSSTNGAVTAVYSYEPFGKTTVTGASPNPFQYTGRENDATGLYYYRARYYSPTLHRFISEDPIEFAGGDVNLYGYVGNNPTNFIDPEGLSTLLGGRIGTNIRPGRLSPSQRYTQPEAQRMSPERGPAPPRPASQTDPKQPVNQMRDRLPEAAEPPHEPLQPPCLTPGGCGGAGGIVPPSPLPGGGRKDPPYPIPDLVPDPWT